MNSAIKNLLRRIRTKLLGQSVDAARITNLENGIVARFDALNRRLDADQELAERRTQAWRGIGEEFDRLDGYLVYHINEIRRDIARCEKRAQTRSFYSAKNLDAVLLHGGFDIVLPADEAGLIAFLLRHETVEPGVTALIRSLVSDGDVAIDVGASIGLHTLTMAQSVGEHGKVFAFEPHPEIARALRKTLLINGLNGRTSLHAQAASDQPRKVRLYRTEHSPESSMFAVPHASEIEVDSVTIDDIVPAGTAVNLVKIDVEGAEPLVYDGMQRVVKESPNLRIVMEWSRSHFSRSGRDQMAFFSQLKRDGFNAYRIDDERPGRVTKLEESIECLEAVNLLLRQD